MSGNHPLQQATQAAVAISPFGKLKHRKYLILEMLQHAYSIDDALNFLWSSNRETREYIKKQYLTVKRGYILEGLIIQSLNFSKEGAEL